jgi:hypothetical protein
LNKNKPRDGKFNSTSFAASGFISSQYIAALSQLLFVFFAEENKLAEKIRASRYKVFFFMAILYNE